MPPLTLQGFGKDPIINLVANAAEWMIDELQLPVSTFQHSTYRPSRSYSEKPSEIDYAISYLNALAPWRTDDYDDWVRVGMALHSVSDDLCGEWDEWSKQSEKYKPGECEKKWRSFKAGGINIASLGYWAKQDGWTSPWKDKNNSNHATHVEALNARNGHVEPLKRSNSKGSGSSVEMLNVETTINEESIEKFTELVSLKEEQLDLREIFHPEIADKLIGKAESMPVAPEFLMQPFLTIAAGLVGVSATIQLKKGYKLPCILWTGIIGDPGSMKSPSIKVVKEPLEFLQGVASDEYEDSRAAWEEAKRQYELLPKDEKQGVQIAQSAPLMRHFFMEDFTMEGLADVHSQEPSSNGFSIVVDELSGLFNGLDQYRAGGKGNGRQRMLSLKSGSSLKVTTKSKQIFVKKTAVSITGGIQPAILAQLMEDPDDPDGMWGRFLWAAPPFVRPYWSDKEVDIYDFLLGLYRRLDIHLETVYTLSSAAKRQYVEFNNWIADNLLLYAGAARNFLSKLKGDVASIALLLHILDACAEAMLISTSASTTPPVPILINDIIPESVVARAIKLGFYYFRQVLSIHAEKDLPSEIPPQLLRIVGLSQQIGKITTRILCQKKWATNSAEAAQLLNQLGEFNLGTLSKSPKGLSEWEIFKKPFQHVQHFNIGATTKTQHGLDHVETVSTLTPDSFNIGNQDNLPSDEDEERI